MEKNLIINNRELSYSGIFRTDELFTTLNNALDEKKYTKREKKSEELVTPLGRLLQLELRPFKIKTNHITLMIKIRITLDNITEVIEKRHNLKERFQKGDVHIIFDAWSLTDYESRWGMKPLVYFIKAVIHKYLYKFPLEEGFVRELASDTAYVYAQVKNLLQSYQGKKLPPLSEQEVLRRVEEEMMKKSSADI
ncbi:MAG TPA: hypothetical protein VJA18_03460 [Candidatus Nanoarchaeia archaeon]|nr:hypothetical protein [Candidatus Nanoarchaeia archaeon]